MKLDTCLTDISNALGAHLKDMLGDEIDVAPLIEHLTNREPAAVTEDGSPMVYLCLAGTGETEQEATGTRAIPARLVAFIRVPAPHRSSGATNALTIVEALLNHIPLQRWGSSSTHPARKVEAADLYGVTTDERPDSADWRTGPTVVSRARALYGKQRTHQEMWAVTWEQAFRIEAEPGTDSSEVPVRAEVRYRPSELAEPSLDEEFALPTKTGR